MVCLHLTVSSYQDESIGATSAIDGSTGWLWNLLQDSGPRHRDGNQECFVILPLTCKQVTNFYERHKVGVDCFRAESRVSGKDCLLQVSSGDGVADVFQGGDGAVLGVLDGVRELLLWERDSRQIVDEQERLLQFVHFLKRYSYDTILIQLWYNNETLEIQVQH